MSADIPVPPISDYRWKALVKAEISHNWELLALKIMMIRIHNATKSDPSPENIERYAKEVHEFFEKNKRLTQKDIRIIFTPLSGD